MLLKKIRTFCWTIFFLGKYNELYKYGNAQFVSCPDPLRSHSALPCNSEPDNISRIMPFFNLQ